MTPTHPPRLDQPSEVIAHLTSSLGRATYQPGSLMVLLADEHFRPILGMAIDNLPRPAPPQHVRIQTLVPFLREVRRQHDEVAAFVLVVCRSGRPDPDGEDLAWHDVAVAASMAGGPRCLGVYLQTPRGAAAVLPRAA